MRNVVQVSCILGFVVLSGCANLTTCSSTAPTRSIPGQDQTAIPNERDQATIRALHKQLQERDQAILYRDQQIEMLSNQLDALKRIDQEEHRRAVRPPVTLAP
jgi:hypothetical protein